MTSRQDFKINKTVIYHLQSSERKVSLYIVPICPLYKNVALQIEKVNCGAGHEGPLTVSVPKKLLFLHTISIAQSSSTVSSSTPAMVALVGSVNFDDLDAPSREISDPVPQLLAESCYVLTKTNRTRPFVFYVSFWLGY